MALKINRPYLQNGGIQGGRRVGVSRSGSVCDFIRVSEEGSANNPTTQTTKIRFVGR